MCTSACQSSYGRDFTYLRELTKIARTNGIYQKLLGKQNLACVRAFLASIDDKVK